MQNSNNNKKYNIDYVEDLSQDFLNVDTVSNGEFETLLNNIATCDSADKLEQTVNNFFEDYLFLESL